MSLQALVDPYCRCTICRPTTPSAKALGLTRMRATDDMSISSVCPVNTHVGGVLPPAHATTNRSSESCTVLLQQGFRFSVGHLGRRSDREICVSLGSSSNGVGV